MAQLVDSHARQFGHIANARPKRVEPCSGETVGEYARVIFPPGQRGNDMSRPRSEPQRAGTRLGVREPSARGSFGECEYSFHAKLGRALIP